MARRHAADDGGVACGLWLDRSYEQPDIPRDSYHARDRYAIRHTATHLHSFLYKRPAPNGDADETPRPHSHPETQADANGDHPTPDAYRDYTTTHTNRDSSAKDLEHRDQWIRLLAIKRENPRR